MKTVGWIMTIVAGLIINVICLLIINHRATSILRGAGVLVGLMGANPNSIESQVSSQAKACPHGGRPGPGVTNYLITCRELGKALQNRLLAIEDWIDATFRVGPQSPVTPRGASSTTVPSLASEDADHPVVVEVGESKPTTQEVRNAISVLKPLRAAACAAVPQFQATGMAASPPLPSTLQSPLFNKSSGLAKASFAIAMIGVGVWFIMLVAAGVSVSAGASNTSPLWIIVGLFMFAMIAGNLVGAGLGIAALTKSISNKWMAVTGVIVNGVERFVILLLMLIGSVQE
jgi:hypothetical protein